MRIKDTPEWLSGLRLLPRALYPLLHLQFRSETQAEGPRLWTPPSTGQASVVQDSQLRRGYGLLPQSLLFPMLRSSAQKMGSGTVVIPGAKAKNGPSQQKGWSAEATLALVVSARPYPLGWPLEGKGLLGTADPRVTSLLTGRTGVLTSWEISRCFLAKVRAWAGLPMDT